MGRLHLVKLWTTIALVWCLPFLSARNQGRFCFLPLLIFFIILLIELLQHSLLNFSPSTSSQLTPGKTWKTVKKTKIVKTNIYLHEDKYDHWKTHWKESDSIIIWNDSKYVKDLLHVFSQTKPSLPENCLKYNLLHILILLLYHFSFTPSRLIINHSEFVFSVYKGDQEI